MRGSPLPKEAVAIVRSILERNNAMNKRAYLPSEDGQKLAALAQTHEVSPASLIRHVRKAQGIVLYHRRRATGDKPGETNYCANCGCHLAKLRVQNITVAFCPGCGRKLT